MVVAIFLETDKMVWKKNAGMKVKFKNTFDP